MEELVNTSMEPGQNPDDYFNQKHLLRHKVKKMGEKISDRYFKDVCVTGLTDEYKDVKMTMYRDPNFNVNQMQTTMRHMFLGEQSRKGPRAAWPAAASPWQQLHQSKRPVSAAERRDTSAGTSPKGEERGDRGKSNQREQPSGAPFTLLPNTPTKNATSKERSGRSYLTPRTRRSLRARTVHTALELATGRN
ncbi:unnamed protein product [Ectocarpus sp. 8 AP-2014]